MIFEHVLKWDTLALQKIILKHLKDQNWYLDNLTMGFSDNGESAFIINAEKKKYIIQIQIENEAKQITIKAGIHGKYLPEGKKIPKYSKVFSHTKISEASKYFEKITEDLK